MKFKKLFIILLAVSVGLLVVGTGAVAASSLFHGRGPLFPQAGDDSPDQYGWGPMHGMGWFDDENDDYYQLHSEMITVVADAAGLTVEEIEARLNAGEQLYSIALKAGVSQADFFELMNEARKTLLGKAVDEGWLSDERYQWMLEQMEESLGYYQGGLFCHSFDEESPYPYGGRGRGGMGGW